MSNSVKHVKVLVAFLAILVSLQTLGIPVAHGDGNDSGNYFGPSSQNYDSATQTTTVTANWNQPGSGGGNPTKNNTPKNNQHPGQVQVCGKWYPAGSAPTITNCGTGTHKGSATPSVADIATSAAAQLKLPINTPMFGPLPSQNQWGMIPVGYPIWLWTSSDQATLTTTVTSSGLTITITATRLDVTFAMGDGHTVTCTGFTTRPTHLTDPMQTSPTCGHVYQVTGTFTITATTAWSIRWSAAGQSGGFNVTDTAPAASPLPIGELSSVITGHP